MIDANNITPFSDLPTATRLSDTISVLDMHGMLVSGTFTNGTVTVASLSRSSILTAKEDKRGEPRHLAKYTRKRHKRK